MQNILKYAMALALGALGLSAQEATVISIPHQGPAVAPNGSYKGIAATSVTTGMSGPNNVTPCFNCVPGVTGNVTLGFPFYLLTTDGMNALIPNDVTLLIEDADYTGPCTGVYVLLQNNVTVKSGTQEIFGGCTAGTDYMIYWTGAFSSEGGTSGVLKGGVAIAAGPVASAVEQPLQINSWPAPSGVVGPTTITIGVPEAGLPCYGLDCVAAWGTTPTLSIPTPMYVVPVGQPLVVTLEIEDISYAGPCTFVYQIKQGTTAVADGAHSATCSEPSIRIPTFNVTIPSDTPSGPAILSGGVVAGGQTYAMYQPILIQ
jgi:hypothetical protein